MENDVLRLALYGDAMYGSLEEADPAGKYYLLRVEYFCKQAGKSMPSSKPTASNRLWHDRNDKSWH